MGRPGLAEWNLGFVDLQRGIALAIGTMLLAKVGAQVSFKMHPHRLRKLFALSVILKNAPSSPTQTLRPLRHPHRGLYPGEVSL